MGITSLHLLEMSTTTTSLHLETLVLSKVVVNTEAAVVERRQQSSSPLSVSFYEAWEPWSIRAIVALMSGSQMLFTGLLCYASHSGRKQSFCSVCKLHVVTSCIQHTITRKMQCVIGASMNWKSCAGCSSNENSTLPAFSHRRGLAMLQFASS